MKRNSRDLSVCMIVKNESANLGDALASFMPFADEIVVVDTGSTDNTKEIAAKFTSRIYDFEWIDDFAAARNFALSKATRSHQLWLDADDRFDSQNAAHIVSLKKLFDGKKAFYFILENHREDTPSNRCHQLRCAPILPEVRFEGRVHEQLFPSVVKAGLQLVTTDIIVTHIGYVGKDIRHAKARRNLAIMEKEKAAGRDDGALHFFMGMTYAALEKRQEAALSMEAAMDRFERESYNYHLMPEGYLLLAKLYFELGDRDRSLRYLVRTKSLVEGSPVHNFHIGIVYQKLGKHWEAVEAFRQVLGKECVPTLFPTDPLPVESEMLLHVAYSYYCINNREEALRLVNASVRDGGEIGRSWEWLGTKAFLLENAELAAMAFETARRFGPLEPESWGRLAVIYKLRGFSQKAKECIALAKAGIEAAC